MNSQFNENELFKLYKKFQELDEQTAGVLTNQELLNLSEFKFTPFRRRLLYGLQLKNDEQVRIMKNQEKEQYRLEDLDNMGV